MKDDYWCQTLGQFTGVDFPDLKPDSFNVNSMKFDLNVSIKVKIMPNDQDL